MSQKQKIFKFIFTAHISKLVINAKVNTPLVAIWKRSKQSVSTTSVDLVDGTAIINQAIKLPVNMYQQVDSNKFVEKKSQFNFTMSTPKGDKSAGVVVVDLAVILNQKMENLEKDFPLEKCPAKDSYVHINITAECISQKAEDSISLQNQSFVNNDVSSLQVESGKNIASKQKITNQDDSKDLKIKQLEAKVAKLQKMNKQLQKELKIVSEKNSKMRVGQQSQNELSKVRSKLEVIYQNLKKNFSGLP